MLKLMYPHEVDRYRIMQKLVRIARMTNASEKQTALAQRARVKQSTISNLENLEHTLISPKRHVTRENLLKVLTWGLELEQEKLDTILWLYDGETLREDEIRRYVRGYLTEASPKTYNYNALCRRVFDYLREQLKCFGSSDVPHHATVDIIFSTGDEHDQLKVLQMLYQLEEIPGQLLKVSRYPSYVTHPPEAYQTGELIPPNVTSENVRREARSINIERQKMFIRHLSLYGERHILSKSDLEKYFLNKEHHHYLSLEQRYKQIQHLICLLEAHEHYEVGLARATPGLEPCTKSTVQALVRAAPPYEEGELNENWGPAHLCWSDEATVLSFFLDFEKAWEEIPAKDRQKEDVIAWLKGVSSNGPKTNANVSRC